MKEDYAFAVFHDESIANWSKFFLAWKMFLKKIKIRKLIRLKKQFEGV